MTDNAQAWTVYNSLMVDAVLHAARNEELYTLLFPRFGQGLDQWRLSLRLRFFCFGFFIRIPPWIAS